MSDLAEKKTRHDADHAAPEGQAAKEQHQGASVDAHRRAGRAAVKRIAHMQDLGTLENPGHVLKGTVHTLAPGGSLRFSVKVNQIWGLGEVTVHPAAGLKLTVKEVAPMQHGVLGSTSLQQYTLTLDGSAHPASHFTVHTSGNYQVRSNPDWAFAFTVVAG